MTLTFLGTRGGIIARSPLHYMHSVLLIQYKKTSILIDWGADWLHKKPPIVNGLLLTHGHSDHVGGLARGFPAPVYATQETFSLIKRYPIEKYPIIPDHAFTIGSISITPFAVFHSVRAPAVGYRIQAGLKTLFYVPDLVAIKKENEALTGVDVYIGDGAILKRRLLVRENEGVLTGHSPIQDQLGWCKQYKVPTAVFTHCGSEIVKEQTDILSNKMQILEDRTRVKTRIASDGLVIKL